MFSFKAAGLSGNRRVERSRLAGNHAVAGKSGLERPEPYTTRPPTCRCFIGSPISSSGAPCLLVLAGSLVTSTGSGLAVPDWPTTYGWNMFTVPAVEVGRRNLL